MDRRVVSFTDNDDRIRWQINDFVYTPDYLYPMRYDTYENLGIVMHNSIFEKCNPASFPERFFDVLNFSTDRLTELKLRAGKDLSSDLKITFDSSVRMFDGNIFNLTINHRFYIITGKQLVIGNKGVEKVV